MTYPPPRAEDALTFDEAEAAGLDGTLRTVGGSRRTCEGDITLVRSETLGYRPCTVTEEGNIEIGEFYKTEVYDIESTSLWCEDCGLLTGDDYERHGIADDWEER